MLRLLVHLGINKYHERNPAFLHEDVEFSKDVKRDCTREVTMPGADYVGRRCQKPVFLRDSNDFPLIVRLQWRSSQCPVRVSRRPAGADRKPKEFQQFCTVPFVGVDLRDPGSFGTFLDCRRPYFRIIDFPKGCCRFIDNYR